MAKKSRLKFSGGLTNWRVKPSPCPYCSALCDTATGLVSKENETSETVDYVLGHRSRPTPGSFTVCVQCQKVAIFDANLLLRPFTEADYNYLKLDPRFAKFLTLAQITLGHAKAATFGAFWKKDPSAGRN